LSIHPTENNGYGVERSVDSPYAFFVNYSQGFKGLPDSDFQYENTVVLQATYIIGPLGVLM
jgi:hypothetical protein